MRTNDLILVEFAAWSSAEERFEAVVEPLNAKLQALGIGVVEKVLERWMSSEHFLTGAVTYTDAIQVELRDLNLDLPKLKAALEALRLNCAIHVVDQGRSGFSLIRPSGD